MEATPSEVRKEITRAWDEFVSGARRDEETMKTIWSLVWKLREIATRLARENAALKNRVSDGR